MAESATTQKLSKRLTMQDSTFLYGESQNSPLHIGTISIFEGAISFKRLVEHMNNRLHLIPRYRQRLAFVPLNLNHATWEDDPDFRIEKHLKRHELSKGATESEMIALALKIHEAPMDRSRPLWEMHSLEGLEGGRTGVLWKIHHCMIDGVSGVELTTVALDFTADAMPPAPPSEPWSPAPLPGKLKRLGGAILDSARAQLDTTQRTLETALDLKQVANNVGMMTEAVRTIGGLVARPIASTSWATRLVSQRRKLAWSRFAFSDFRKIRAALGGTVNDVVLTVLSEGAARYLNHHGYLNEGKSFRIGCPVNVRKKEESQALGNRVSMMFPELPAEPMDPVARLRAVMQETEAIKASGAAQAVGLLAETAEQISPALAGGTSAVAMRAFDAAVSVQNFLQKLLPSFIPRPSLPNLGISFIATNVPGVMVPQYLAGHECADAIGLIPLAANVGYGVAITSYNKNLYFAMMGEPNVLPDIELMKSFVDDTFEELKRVAEETAKAAAAADAPLSATQPTEQRTAA